MFTIEGGGFFFCLCKTEALLDFLTAGVKQCFVISLSFAVVVKFVTFCLHFGCHTFDYFEIIPLAQQNKLKCGIKKLNTKKLNNGTKNSIMAQKNHIWHKNLFSSSFFSPF